MEYKESPSINSANRKVVFPVIKWLSKIKFEEYLRLEAVNPFGYKIQPYLNAADEENEDTISNRIYIGKSLPTNSDESMSLRIYYSNSNVSSLEVIGSVMKNVNGEWELKVSHGSSVIVIKRDFLVLCISDPDSFEWIRTQNDMIPKYAIRGANDQFSKEYFYIGRTIRESQIKAKYYNGSLNVLNEIIPHLFGKVHVGHKVLYAPHNNLELVFSDYETLCLKPAPASLKILARLKIRTMLNNSNKSMSLINQKHKVLPDALLNFIKFPSFLSVGEFMLKGEKITDDKFEISIESNGDLVCKPILDDETSYEDCDLVKRIICNNVHSIWLHRFQVIFFLTSNRFHVAHTFFNKSPEYRLMINYNMIPPSYQIKED